MEKFIQAIVDRDFETATKELEGMANSFGFYHEVPEIAEALEPYRADAVEFCGAFLKAMVQRYPDGRDEKSIGIAKTILDEITLESSRQADSAVRSRIVEASMHPTVMQQAAQLVFCVLGQYEMIPERLKTYRDWWRMPLI